VQGYKIQKFHDLTHNQHHQYRHDSESFFSGEDS